MKAPATFDELLAYLTDHPTVDWKQKGGIVSLGLRDFAGYDSGSLRFKSQADGKASHLPVDFDLGLVDSEMAFHDDRFVFTRFGATIEVHYVPWPDLSPEPAEADDPNVR